MTKHTPATWVCIDNRYGVYVREDGEVIAQMVGDFSRNEKENHAKLIAAAPDLLEALIELFSVTVLSKENIDAMEKARTAIAKATGSTNDSNS